MEQRFCQGDPGHVHVQDEQRGGDGEYAVTEGLESPRCHGGRLALLWPAASGRIEQGIRDNRSASRAGMDAPDTGSVAM